MMMKKSVIILVVAAIFLCGMPVLAAPSDQPSKWAKADVSAAIKAGLVPEDLQSKYQEPITRGEFAKLLVQTAFASYKHDATRPDGTLRYDYWTQEEFLNRVTVDVNFKDADEDYIKIAFALGSVNGVSDTKFAPDALITRQEAATMLANTMQIQVGFEYLPNSIMGYKDFEKIADWAKPAVQLVYSTDVMRGVGDRFDYGGKYTREQAISTFYRVYDQGKLDNPAMRGVIMTNSPYDELTYYVSKDYVHVDFDETKTGNNSITEWGASAWRTFDVTNKKPYDKKLAVAVYGFSAIMKPRDFDVAISGTVNGKSTKIDYGYMTVTTLNGDHLLTFEFKDVPGYATLVGGYNYGYPKKEVQAKVIK